MVVTQGVGWMLLICFAFSCGCEHCSVVSVTGATVAA